MRKKKIKVKKIVFIMLFLASFTFSIAQNSFPSKVIVNGLNIIYDKFDGNTSTFNLYNETQLENLSNMTLERVQYGKILFLQPMNVVSMAVNWTVNFNKNINISSNLIYVDNSGLPNINKSAILTFRGINLTHPIVYHNAAICTDCSFINYSSGNYVFNISSFNGVYYLRENTSSPYCGDGVCNGVETSITCPADCYTNPPSGGGSGGSGAGSSGGSNQNPTIVTSNGGEATSNGADFSVYPLLSGITMRKGTYFQKYIIITNNGTVPLSIHIGVSSNLSKYVFPEVNSIYLKPDESENVRFDIYVSNKVPNDIYIGKLLFSGGGISRDSKIILQVTAATIFDMRTRILKKYITPGGRVRANITVLNMGDLRNFDVDLIYKVLDFNQKNYTFKKEQFAINRSHTGTYFLDLPQNISVGNYVFYSMVNYKGVNATSYDTFIVEKVSYLSWIILIIIIISLMILIYRWYLKRRAKLYEEYLRAHKPNKKIKLSEDKEFNREEKLGDQVPELP